MGSKPARAIDDPEIQRLLESFSVDPKDGATFQTLEERLFVDAAWSQLAGVYECRISALAPEDESRLDLVLRLANILHERLGDATAARRRYQEVLAVDEHHVEALGCLRRLHTANGELTQAVQVSEIEESLSLPPKQRARVLTEIGDLWYTMGDFAESQRRFDQALRLDPHCDAAQAGCATLAEAEGRTDEAILLNERRLEGLSGPLRYKVMEHLAELLPDSEAERIRTLLREVVRVSPERRRAIERLIDVEHAEGAWDRVDELQRRLFDIVRDPVEKMCLAQQAAVMQLEEASDINTALYWTAAANEIGPHDPDVQKLRARILRRAGQTEGVIDALERLVEADGGSPMLLLELSVLYERDGQPERAVEWLERLLDTEPRDAEALVVLDRCLQRLDRHPERADVLARRVSLVEDAAQAADLLTELGDLRADAQQDLAAAEEAYRRALEQVPEHVGATGQLKQLLAKAERFDDLAVLLEQQALRPGPAAHKARSWCELGSLRLESQADAAGARSAFLGALDADPECSDALAGLRQIAADTEDPSSLIECCERELALDPETPRSIELLREIADVSRRAGDLPRSLRATQRWGELDASTEPLFQVTDIAREMNDPRIEANALEGLDTLLGAQPEKRALVLARLGDLALEQPDPDAADRAASWYRGALALVPDGELRMRLIDLLRRTGQMPELVRELRAYISTAEDDPPTEMHVELARGLAETGDLSGAVEELRRPFESHPANADVADLLESLLAEQDRVDELTDVLQRRLQHERNPVRRRELAHRHAGLLLDGMARAADAVAVLQELADPSREGQLEDLYQRALDAGGTAAQQEAWLGMRETHVDGADRLALLLRLAALQEQDERIEDALESLRRARRVADEDHAGSVKSAMLALLRKHGSPDRQLRFLEQVLEETHDPAERATFRIERAHVLASSLGEPERALRDLEQAQREAPLGVEELRLVASLYASTKNPVKHAKALETLADALTNEGEKRTTLLELAALRVDGPPAARDTDAAAVVLMRLLDTNPADAEAFDRLSVLYEAENRSPELCALLAAKLDSGELADAERTSMAMRLARMQMGAGQASAACETIHSARRGAAPNPALDELLLEALDAAEDLAGRVALCEEMATRPADDDTPRWMRRWLRALEANGADTEARLTVVERLLESAPDDTRLHEARLPLLRELGRHEDLATVLETLLLSRGLAGPRRKLYMREALQLFEGPADNPERALNLLEREAGGDAGLRQRGARLAQRIGDSRREAAMLGPLVREQGGDATPENVRRLGLALWKSGREDEAESLLWDSLANYPNDRELLGAVETLVRRRDDPASLLRLLEARFTLEAGDARIAVAREGFELSEQERRSEEALRWIRRLQAIDDLPRAELERWLRLERSTGDRPGTLLALRALADATENPKDLAELLAAAGALHFERGQLSLARDEYREALRSAAQAPVEWLQKLDLILKRLGETGDRVDVLRELSRHADLQAEERVSYQKERIALLGSHPELREEAALELRMLLESDPGSSSQDQVLLMRDLLDLYDQLGRTAEWCAQAERLAELLPDDEAREIERRIARNLTHPLCATDEAISAWQRILRRDVNDPEALGELVGLLRRPGQEARLVAALERWAGVCEEPRPDLLLEAAQVRWNALGDARAALSAVDAALELDPALNGAQQLRSELCARLDRPDEEEAALRAIVDTGAEASASHWLRIAELAASQPEKSDAALDACERALALDENRLPTLRLVRPVLERVGQWERAAELLYKEIEAADDGQVADLRRHLARIEWEELERPAETCAVLEALADTDTLRADDHERWADALAAQRRWNESIHQRRAALDSMADMATAQGWYDVATLALEHIDDPTRALDACDRALQCDPTFNDALSLRAELHARMDAPAHELEDILRLAEHLTDDAEAAQAYAKAAKLSRERLGDDARAWALYRKALKRDAAWAPALLGAGEIALERREWAEAERMFGLACSLLPGTELATRLGDAARMAAVAASEQKRNAEAYRYLEVALAENEGDAGALDAMIELSLRLGAYERARDCLDTRLGNSDLEPSERAERLLKLAQACEGCSQSDRAAAALEEAVAIRPADEVSRARAVDMLERIGETDRAVIQIDGWMRSAPDGYAPRLALRAAQLELSGGHRADARRRLESLIDDGDAPAAAWAELARLRLDDDGPESALEIAERGIETLDVTEQGDLLWLATQSLEALGRIPEAAQRSCQTLAADPTNVPAAQLLAAHLGHVSDWAAAVNQLERTLDVAHPTRAVEAELWEAIGRSYAGPLEDLERAQLCYRRALECNSMRASAREALADITAYDPAAHRESIRLHRDLLEEYPGRLGSWRSIEKMGLHWRRERPMQTCVAVLRALGASTESDLDDGDLTVLVESGPPSDPSVRSATEVLLALGEADALPAPDGSPSLTGLPVWARKEIAKTVGPGWDLSDDTLRGLWLRPFDDANEELPRRTRRKLKRTLSAVDAESARSLDPLIWREQIIAQAAALALESGRISLKEIMLDLLALWPDTADLDLRGGGSMAAAIQSCPPARTLLLRIGEGAITGLGL